MDSLRFHARREGRGTESADGSDVARGRGAQGYRLHRGLASRRIEAQIGPLSAEGKKQLSRDGLSPRWILANRRPELVFAVRKPLRESRNRRGDSQLPVDAEEPAPGANRRRCRGFFVGV